MRAESADSATDRRLGRQEREEAVLSVSRNDGRRFSRRGVLALGLPALVGLTPLNVLAHAGGGRARSLMLHNVHTGEKLKTVYYVDGRYLRESLTEINWILRDWRTDEEAAIDRQVLDQLHRLQTVMNTNAPFDVISGYRSPKTNQMLRRKGRGVAKKSLHMRGMAVDVALPGRDLRQLYRAAKSLQAGGVGIYSGPGFIHLDSGRVRSW